MLKKKNMRRKKKVQYFWMRYYVNIWKHKIKRKDPNMSLQKAIKTQRQK